MEAIKGFFKKITENKYFKKLALPGAVVLIGALMLILAPWQTGLGGNGNGDGDDVVDGDVLEPPAGDIASTVPPRTPRPPQTPSPDTGIYHPLTGERIEEDVSHIRPWAVAIGNSREALPQKGIAQADIICEYYIEGATRLMAIYQDISDLEIVGGIRSLRTSSMELAGGFDAIFAHWIGRVYSGAEVHGNPVTRYNTIDASNVGFREPGSKPLEHRAMSSGERFLDALPTGFRTEHEDGYSQTLLFKEDGTPEGGGTARNVEVSFIRNSKTTTFEYDADEQEYFVTQYNTELFDANNGHHLSFTNVIVMQTELRTGFNELGHTYIRTTGEGTGFFICGGRYVEITWQRTELTDPYSFFLKDGSPLELGVGKTYICIISDSVTPTFR